MWIRTARHKRIHPMFWSITDLREKPVWRYVWPAALLLLTACATHKTAPGWAAPVRPPVELTEPVAEPPLPEPLTNGSLAEWADELRAALREANRRLRVIQGL